MRQYRRSGTYLLIALAFGATLLANDEGLAAAVDTQLQQLDSRLSRIERMMRNEVLYDMMRRLDALEQEVRMLRGEAEVDGHKLSQVQAKIRETYLDLDKRLQQLEGPTASSVTDATTVVEPSAVTAPAISGAEAGSQPGGALPVPAVTPGPATSPAPAADRSAAARDAYKRAFTLLREGRYEASSKAFANYLQDFPGTVYADNAQYWLAESYAAAGNHATASNEFRKVLENYPDSDKVPDATLKLGFSYYELKQWNEARKTLTQVRDQYANSSVARLAENRLERMRREGH